MKEMLKTTVSENENIKTSVNTVTEEIAAMREALESSVEDIAIIKEEVGKAKKAKKVKALIESSKDETMDALKRNYSIA